MYADYTDRYGHDHRLNRTSLTASALIVGGLLASVALVAPKVIPPRPIIIVADPIPIQEPPPPDRPHKPQPQTRTAQRLPTVPIPRVPIPQPTTPIETTIDLKPIPERPIDLGLGNGADATPVPTPTSSPVFVDAGIDPRYAGDFQPSYPPEEQRAGRDGEVKVKVVIGSDGRVKSLEPISQTSDAFLAATRRQARTRWRFKPATRGGVPVESAKVMTVHFVLHD